MIAHWDDVEASARDVGHLRGRWHNLGVASGSVDVGLNRIRLDDGGIPTPAHVHHGEEELFHVLAGSGLSWQDGKSHEVRAGDTLVHRTYGQAHTLRAGPAGLDVLAFGERRHGAGALLPRAGVMWAGPSWIEVGHGASPWRREADAGSPDFSELVERPATTVALDSVRRKAGGRGGSEYHFRDLGRAAGSERTGLKLYEVAAGKLGPPPHCHSVEEELFVVLEGEGELLLIRAPDTLGTGTREGLEERHAVRKGHVVSRPAGSRVAHAFIAGGEGLAYLAYGTRNPGDVAYYPRSNKLYWRGVGVIGRIERLDYWEGEA